MSPSSFDQTLIQHVAKRNSLSLRLENELSHRRGAKMLELSSDANHFGLKVATEADSSVAREASVLKDLSDFTHNLYLDSGTYKGCFWLLMNWVSGQSVYRRVKELRGGSKSDLKPKLLDLFARMFSKVADLHDLGFLHGDLQPEHFKVTGDIVHLLDLGLTHRQNEFDYPGALVHFSAPEICKQQVSGRSPVVYCEAAELYSLASVVFFLYTGSVSADYGSEGMKLSYEKKLERIAAGRRATFASVGCEPFEELEAVLEKCLTFDKRERYSSVREAAQELNHHL